MIQHRVNEMFRFEISNIFILFILKDVAYLAHSRFLQTALVLQRGEVPNGSGFL